METSQKSKSTIFFAKYLAFIVIGSAGLVVFLTYLFWPSDTSIKISTTTWLIVIIVAVVILLINFRKKIPSVKKYLGWTIAGVLLVVAIVGLFIWQPWNRKYSFPLSDNVPNVDRTTPLVIKKLPPVTSNQKIAPVLGNFKEGWNDFKKDSTYTYIRGNGVGINFTTKDCGVKLYFEKVGFPNVYWEGGFDQRCEQERHDVHDDGSSLVLFSFKVDRDVTMYIQIK